MLHALDVEARATLRFADVAALATLGVDAARWQGRDYATTQPIADAAQFLGFDGLLVPSARWPGQNMVIFTERLAAGAITPTGRSGGQPVRWEDWSPP